MANFRLDLTSSGTFINRCISKPIHPYCSLHLLVKQVGGQKDGTGQRRFFRQIRYIWRIAMVSHKITIGIFLGLLEASRRAGHLQGLLFKRKLAGVSRQVYFPLQVVELIGSFGRTWDQLAISAQPVWPVNHSGELCEEAALARMEIRVRWPYGILLPREKCPHPPTVQKLALKRLKVVRHARLPTYVLAWCRPATHRFFR